MHHDSTCTAWGNVNRFGVRPALLAKLNVTVHGYDAHPTRLFLNYAMCICVTVRAVARPPLLRYGL
jgi:hypothetical protein